MKLLHISDEHWDTELLDRCKASAGFIERVAEEHKPNLILITGDLQHKRQVLTGSSAVNPMFGHVQALANVAPVLILYGNQEHDPEGSLMQLQYLTADNAINVASQLVETYLIAGFRIHILPYPTRSHYLAGRESTSIDEANFLILDQLKNIFMGFSADVRNASEPIILAGHANIQSARISKAQVIASQDIIIPADDLLLARAHYYAFGHIHINQEIGKKGSGIWYAGSTYHINFGETDKKYVNLVEFKPLQEIESWTIEVHRIEIETAIPLSLHEASVDVDKILGDKLVDMSPNVDWDGAILRVRVRLTQEQKALWSEKRIREIYESEAMPKEIKIEYIIAPTKRLRSDTISQRNQSLGDKIMEWAKIRNETIPAGAIEMANEIEGSL